MDVVKHISMYFAFLENIVYFSTQNTYTIETRPGGWGL